MFRSTYPIKKISRKAKVPGFHVTMKNFADRKVVFCAGKTADRFFKWISTEETLE